MQKWARRFSEPLTLLCATRLDTKNDNQKQPTPVWSTIPSLIHYDYDQETLKCKTENYGQSRQGWYGTMQPDVAPHAQPRCRSKRIVNSDFALVHRF